MAESSLGAIECRRESLCITAGNGMETNLLRVRNYSMIENQTLIT